RRLIDAVLVTQRIEIARLRAEILHGQNADARQILVLLASDGDNVPPFFLRIAECVQCDMDLALAKQRFPILWIVDALVPQLAGTCCHAYAECLREAFQRVLWKTERCEARVADSNRQPGTGGFPPVRGGIDMRCQPAEQLAARSGIV